MRAKLPLSLHSLARPGTWVAALFLASAATVWSSCAWIANQIYPELAGSGPLAVDSKSCGECHADIYNEWLGSAHARAWTSEHFVRVTDTHQDTACLACHAPEPIRDNPEPVLRKERRVEGVNCIACHLVDNMHAGPKAQTAPHPAKGEDPFYLSSAMCGTCHVAAYTEWSALSEKYAAKSKTCQDCHMPPVRREIDQDKPFVYFHKKYDLKKHLFTSTDSELLEDAVEMEIVVEDGAVTVWVENTGVGHSIPTGEYGYHEAVLEVRRLDSRGEPLERKSVSWFAARRNGLAPGEHRAVRFEWPGVHGPLQVELYKANRRGEKIVSIATLEAGR